MKRCLLFVVMTVILLAACVCTVHAEEQLPAEIRDNLSGVTITRSVYVDGSANEKAWFVLGRTGSGNNTLYCYRMKDNKWVRNFSTSKAVPQGKNRVDFYLTAVYQDYTTDKKYTGPVLVIDRMDAGDEYAELSVAYQRSKDGIWNLFRISGYAEYENMLIGDGYISFYRDMEDSRLKGTVSGTFQRDLRYVNLSSFPKTYKQAQQKLTVAPDMPRGSELEATDVKFSGGKNYEVYSAPDKNSIRGGNGKAKVSTNGWIQVFGREGSWILIQYSIDSEHYRFGYIDAASLPKKTSVSSLDFHRISALAGTRVSVTDDPLYSRSVLTTLEAGTEITWLATVGDWAYIEGANYRGFIPVSALAFPEPAGQENFEVFTGSDGEKYDLFEVKKLFYDVNHKVYAVYGTYEHVAEDDDCYYGKLAQDGSFTYVLAPDFTADMMNPETMDPLDSNVPVKDLYAWYIDAYLGGEAPANGELVFQCDIPADQQETTQADFWFVTTRIRLNAANEIEHMEYYYVPWN